MDDLGIRGLATRWLWQRPVAVHQFAERFENLVENGTYQPLDLDYAVIIAVSANDVDLGSLERDPGRPLRRVVLRRAGAEVRILNGNHRIAFRRYLWVKSHGVQSGNSNDVRWDQSAVRSAMESSLIAVKIYNIGTRKAVTRRLGSANVRAVFVADMLDSTHMSTLLMLQLCSNNEITPTQDPPVHQLMRCAASVINEPAEEAVKKEITGRAYHQSVRQIFGNHPQVVDVAADLSLLAPFSAPEIASVVYDPDVLLDMATTYFEVR